MRLGLTGVKPSSQRIRGLDFYGLKIQNENASNFLLRFYLVKVLATNF